MNAAHPATLLEGYDLAGGFARGRSSFCIRGVDALGFLDALAHIGEIPEEWGEKQ